MHRFSDEEYELFHSKLAEMPDTSPDDLVIALLHPGQTLADRIGVAYIDDGVRLLQGGGVDHLAEMLCSMQGMDRALLAVFRTVSPDLHSLYVELAAACAHQLDVVDLISVQPGGWTAVSRAA